jgi:hypothetical protein
MFQAVLPEELDDEEEDCLSIDSKRMILPNIRCPCEEPHIQNVRNILPPPVIPPLPEIKSTETKEEVKADADDGMTCPICQEILKAPMISHCGHSVCQGCLEAIIQKNLRKCPSGCGEVISHFYYFPNFGLSKAIAAKYSDKPSAVYTPNVWSKTTMNTAQAMAEKSEMAQKVIIKGILRTLLHAANLGVQRGDKFVVLNDRQMVEINQHPEVKTELEALGYKLLIVSNTTPPRLNMFLIW